MYIVSLYLHLILVCIWIGGQIFLPLVIIPALKKSLGNNEALKRKIVINSGIIFSKAGRWIILLLLITGILNYYFKFKTFNLFLFSDNPYGKKLLLKISLFILMIVINIIHERKIGNQLINDVDEKEYEHLKKWASFTGRMTLLLSIIILLLGLLLSK
ncbi:MAG: hypothetical protein OHK0036_03740 [Bacteroidia bacterium]